MSDDTASLPADAGVSRDHVDDRVAASRPTMKDVAARAGVGLKTVSRVVNGEAGVTPDTAQRVRAAIDALGFRRNDSARLLRKGQTASIGLVLEDVGNPFYSTLARAVEDVAHGKGSLLLMGSSDEDPERERALTLTFCARRVDGLIVVPASTDHTYLLPEISAGIAVVFVDRPPGLIHTDVVLTDNVGGARDGVGHLISQGHARIGYIGDAPHIYTAGQRLQGYREAMAAAALPVQEHWIAMALAQPDVVRRALDRMLDGSAPVTALLCGNNRISVTVVREVALRGAHVAIIGFDDFELADLLSPGVTVVAQDPAEMGRIAAELLFRRLSGEQGPPQRVELPTRLLVRGSGEIPVKDVKKDVKDVDVKD